jgi:hypothetical protein
MRFDQESMLGALRQAALLAFSGFLFMSGLAALGSGRIPTEPGRSVLDARVWSDTDTFLAHSDQLPEAAHPPCRPGYPDSQRAAADRSSERVSSTSGWCSPTRSIRSSSTSWRSAVASADRPASMSMVAYSNFAPVAKR